MKYKEEVNKQNGCDICNEVIEDCEIKTVESGWFTVDDEIKFCPYCGRKL